MWNGKMKALTFSYDDGVEQDIRLIEILDRYHLRGVDQQLQLRQLKGTAAQIIAAAGAAELDNVKPVFLKTNHIGIDALPLGANAFFGEQIDEGLRGQGMVGVRLRFEDLLEIKKLELLMFRTRHSVPSFYDKVYYKFHQLTSEISRIFVRI